MKNSGQPLNGFFLRRLNDTYKYFFLLIYCTVSPCFASEILDGANSAFSKKIAERAIFERTQSQDSETQTSDDCADICPPSIYDRPQTWKDRMRIRALRNFDQFLSWSFSEKFKTYALISPIEENKIASDIPEMRSFVENYGYFSLKHPIVGKVTTDAKDLELICCLLKVLYEKSDDAEYLQIAVGEVITKALAYHDLKIGQIITIPVESGGKIKFEHFVVDHIFNIWSGMPAFGLVPERKGIASILFFRGTDFSLDSQRGWASLMSNLDMVSPGLSAFQHSQSEIHRWLKAVSAKGRKARVLGFSLGGVLAAYTFIYENRWLSDQGSISFCAPGVREKVISEWQLLSEERQNGFTSFVNMGDITSKIGKLFGNVYELSTSKTFKPLTAHTMLISSYPLFSKAKVDVEQENENR
jgi:hypothetical protein